MSAMGQGQALRYARIAHIVGSYTVMLPSRRF